MPKVCWLDSLDLAVVDWHQHDLTNCEVVSSCHQLFQDDALLNCFVRQDRF